MIYGPAAELPVDGGTAHAGPDWQRRQLDTVMHLFFVGVKIQNVLSDWEEGNLFSVTERETSVAFL